MTSRLLLVDDDPLARDIIKAILESAGYPVDIALDAFEALAALQATPYALALVDYHLPEMDGYAFARVLQQRAARGDEPVARPRLVAITADRHGLATRRGFDAVFDAVLAKPLQPATLIAEVERVLACRPAEDRLPQSPAERFLTDPRQIQARAFADTLWRRYGLHGRPRLAFSPAPDAGQSAILEPFFEIAEPASACAVGLLHGDREAPRDPALALLPVVGFHEEASLDCDEMFRVGDIDGWDRLAQLILAMSQRRALLRSARPSARLEERLLQFLFVWDRVLIVEPGPRFEALAHRLGSTTETFREAVERAIAGGSLRGLRALGPGERNIVTLSPEGTAAVCNQVVEARLRAADGVQEQHRTLAEAFAPTPGLRSSA
jgi:CheY-like chemotaxis protein